MHAKDDSEASVGSCTLATKAGACLGGISHTRSAIINLYEIFANDYLTVTNIFLHDQYFDSI